VLISVFAGAGCGGGDGIGLDELQGRFAAALCKFYVACAEMPDLATCTASLQEQPGYLATLDADIASGKVRWDGVKARSCMETFERVYSTSCKYSEITAATEQFKTTCEGVITGMVPPGGACFFSEQCAAPAVCQPTAAGTCSRSRQCCPGTCIAIPDPVQIGGDCSNLGSYQTCVEGSACAAAAPGATLTCVVPSTVEGTACTSPVMCKAPLYCVYSPSAASGTCQPAVATGAACIPGGGPMPCDDLRDYCDATTGTCTRRIAVGGSCGAQSVECIGYATCAAAVCVAQLKAGEACSPTSGSCLGGLQCDATTSTCTLAPVGTSACM
jgi:hypothetical protein